MLITQKHCPHKLGVTNHSLLFIFNANKNDVHIKHGEFILYLHNLFIYQRETLEYKCIKHSECGIIPPRKCLTVSNSFLHYVILLSWTTRGFFRNVLKIKFVLYKRNFNIQIVFLFFSLFNYNFISSWVGWGQQIKLKTTQIFHLKTFRMFS